MLLLKCSELHLYRKNQEIEPQSSQRSRRESPSLRPPQVFFVSSAVKLLTFVLTFLCLVRLSPTSLKSPICSNEVTYAPVPTAAGVLSAFDHLQFCSAGSCCQTGPSR